MIPLPFGGVRITVQRTTVDKFDDHTYVDHHQIDGCVDFSGKGVTGRNGSKGGVEIDNSVTQIRTLYAPHGSDILSTDRVIIHPPGVDLIPVDDAVTRRVSAYQVMGLPTDWTHGMSGWQPGMELLLERVY